MKDFLSKLDDCLIDSVFQKIADKGMLVFGIELFSIIKFVARTCLLIEIAFAFSLARYSIILSVIIFFAACFFYITKGSRVVVL